jgi:hypothetical protein
MVVFGLKKLPKNGKTPFPGFPKALQPSTFAYTN